MPLNAFMPQGNTYLVAASSSTSVAATQWSTVNGKMGLYLSNPSSVTIYCAFGSSSVQASMPSTSTPSAGFAIRSASDRSLNLTSNPTNSWLSAVTSAGTATPGLLITPGFGL